MERKTIKLAIAVAIVYANIAIIFCCCVGWHWWVLTVLLPVTAEYAAQYYKFKTWNTPMIKAVCRAAKKLRKHKVVIAPAPNLITSITDITAKDFFKNCLCESDYTVLGSGTYEQRKAAFDNLLSQYYEVRKDKNVEQYIKLVSQIKAIELRRALVYTITDIMNKRYSESGAESLRKHYKMYQFTRESYLHDLEMVAKAEIANEIKHEQLVKQLQKYEVDEAKEVKITPDKQYQSFVSRLMDINKLEGVKYDIHTMSVMEFALAEHRLMLHIKNLEEQARQSKK